MRVAVLILGLVGFVISGAQSCAIAVAGSASEALSSTDADKQEASDLTTSASLGILGALIWVVGAAFALGKPMVSVVAFAIAAAAWLSAAGAGFSDGYMWAGFSAILAGLSYLGARRPREQGEAGATQAVSANDPVEDRTN